MRIISFTMIKKFIFLMDKMDKELMTGLKIVPN